MKTKLLFIVIAFCVLFGCKENKQRNELRIAVENVEAALPSEMFDGYSMESILIDENEKTVTITINPWEGFQYPYGISQEEKADAGKWMVNEIMKGYRYTEAGHGGEGKPEMWLAVGPLLKMMARNDICLKLTVNTSEAPFTLDVSSDTISKVIKDVNAIHIDPPRDKNQDEVIVCDWDLD